MEAWEGDQVPWSYVWALGTKLMFSAGTASALLTTGRFSRPQLHFETGSYYCSSVSSETLHFLASVFKYWINNGQAGMIFAEGHTFKFITKDFNSLLYFSYQWITGANIPAWAGDPSTCKVLAGRPTEPNSLRPAWATQQDHLKRKVKCIGTHREKERTVNCQPDRLQLALGGNTW